MAGSGTDEGGGPQRCAAAVEATARSVLALLADGSEAARRDVVLVHAERERAVLLGASGAARVAEPLALPGAPGGAAPRRGCVAALCEHGDDVLLADLLAAGVTCVGGPPDAAGRLTARLAVDSLGGRWALHDELVLVGFGAGVPRARRVVALDSPAAAAEHRARHGAALSLVALAPGATADGRALERLVALASEPSSARTTALLLPIAHPAAELLVLAGVSRPDEPPPLFLPARLTRDARRRRGDGPWRAGLLAVPFPRAGVRMAVPGGGPGRAGRPPSVAMRALPGLRSADHRPSVTAQPVEVAVLGPVEVRGAEQSLERRPTLTELVTYLALHPEGASTATWATAIWPDRRVPTQTVANRLSEARRCLGVAPDGLPHLRRCADRHLVVDVTTDWERFRRLAAPGDPAGRRAALSLVRGRPFANLRSGSWTVLEGLDGEIVAAVTACARDLGDALLSLGDTDGAAWAAQRGLRVAPWDERLHRLLMRAADAAGDRAGVDAVLRQLAVLLETGDPLRAVHPQTAALYADLTARPSRAYLGPPVAVG